MTKPFAWSFSALSTYEQCPKKYYHLYVARDVKDTDSSYAEEGKRVHDALRWRVMENKPLPLDMRHYEKIAVKFAGLKGEKHAEMKLALDRDMEPVGYFDKGVYVRALVDFACVQGNTALVIDWKTGKVKEDFTQLGLSAAVLARWMPEVEIIKTAYVWVNHRHVSPRSYTISKITAVWSNLIPRADKIEEARKTTTFPARPGPLCAWCPVRECPHWISRD